MGCPPVFASGVASPGPWMCGPTPNHALHLTRPACRLSRARQVSCAVRQPRLTLELAHPRLDRGRPARHRGHLQPIHSGRVAGLSRLELIGFVSGFGGCLARKTMWANPCVRLSCCLQFGVRLADAENLSLRLVRAIMRSGDRGWARNWDIED